MGNTLNLGDGNWGVKNSSFLGYRKDGTKFLPETFDVTRASSGTRVNKDGLIEAPTEILSGELVTNGDFSDGSTDWNLQTGWSYSDGIISKSLAVASYVLQSSILTIGTTYKVSFTISNYVSGVFGLNTTFWGVTHQYSSNGTYSIIATTTNTNLYLYSDDSFVGSIDNVSVVEINQDNLARIDYTDGVEGVLLTEPQSTNLIPTSDITDNAWNCTRTVPTSGHTSPSTDSEAYLLTEDTSNNTHYTVENITVTDASVYTFSVFAKPNGRNWVNLSFDTNGYYFDLENKVVGTQIGTPLDYSITEFANGFIRLTVSAAAIGVEGRCQFSLADSDNSDIYQGDGTSGAYVWGFQVEQLSYATSYIPTSGTIATRAADVVANGGDVSNFNSEEGVLYFEGSFSDWNVGGEYQLSISDGTGNNRIMIFPSSQTNVGIRFNANSVQLVNQALTVTDINVVCKLAIAWGGGNYKLYQNGVEIYTQAIADTPTGLSKLNLGSITGASNLLAKTKNIQVFNTVLTDAELITLTT